MRYNRIVLNFEEGMPRGTAQQKGERVMFGKNGKPYVLHYKKKNVANARADFVRMLKPYAPDVPSDKPIKLSVLFVFDVKDKKKWGKYKTSRPDNLNFFKEPEDAMTEVGFWFDDSQVVKHELTKVYGEKARIVILVEELEEEAE